MVYHVSNSNFYQGYNTYNKNRALAAATKVVNEQPPTGGGSSSTDIIQGIKDFAHQSAFLLIGAGLLGLISRPLFKYQDKGIFHTIYIGSSITALALGAYGLMTPPTNS